MDIDNDYLLTLSGHNVFREVELTADMGNVCVGTTQRCDVRFRKEAFFETFEIKLNKGDDQWIASCSEEIYFSVDGVRKLAYKELEHGDTITVKYSNSDVVLFVMSFAIHFDRDKQNYDRYVDLSDIQILTIGGMTNSNLCLRSRYISNDLISLQRQGEEVILSEQVSTYGVFCNGIRVKEPVTFQDKSFVTIANFHFYYSDDKLYFSKLDDIVFNEIAYRDIKTQQKYSEYPRFNRNTRIKSAMDKEPIPILDPPAKPEKPKTNIIVQLLPAIGMLAVTVLLRGVMSTSGSSFVFYSIAMMSVGILASVVGIVNSKRQYKKDVIERKEKYNQYVKAKEEEITDKRAEELSALNHMYPSLDEVVERVSDFSGDLFDRCPDDSDFLHVRLGIGAVESSKQISYKTNEKYDSDELSEIPKKINEKYHYIEQAPTVLDLATAGAMGLVGPESKTYGIVKDMVVDLCTRQYQTDVRLFFVVEEENEELVHWARSLPHVQNEDLNMRNIVCDEESRNILFEYLFKELSDRETVKQGGAWEHLVIFVIDECGLKNHPLSRFVDNAADLGVTFVFIEPLKEYLPMGCSSIVMLDNKENEGNIIETENDKSTRSFTYDFIEDTRVLSVAETLAPVYCEEISLEGTLTKNITLFEMLGIIAADDLNLQERWASSVVFRSMAAPLGVSKSRTIYLDLSDKAHGPHGLVAGTTGSGKSEILQTYILSMATLFHPYEVGFMIIDFKGGGMVNQFAELPHLMGAITNIDGREIDRSLKSIKAELQKRQRFFAAADVNHINNYIKKYKSGEVAEPLPHLIIIVDEFAELKAEQPEFMKELISAARIGRSLGVHLILATQKPAGQVNEQIWSNSRFKLCLKVATKEDSNEVLKSPLAAEIKEPGRAYLQVGNNEIFELFQSAFSGAPEHTDEEAIKEFSIYQLENSGKRVPIYTRKKEKSDALSSTQLDAVVQYVSSYCKKESIPALASICLPPLPDIIQYPENARLTEKGFSLGLFDDPDSQYQGEAFFDLANTNTLIVGSSQMGKTNLLQVAIRSIVQFYTPHEASIYICDFASMILKNFEGLNHVGGVVVPGEDEKLKNMFKLLNEEISNRKKRLLEVGVSSFSAYLEAGYNDLPKMFVIMDNFAVFRELYSEQFESDFLFLCREGITYGVTVMVTNATTTGFGYKYMSNFSTHIALTCNDTSEYGIIFDRCRMEPKNIPGRALCSINKTLYEFQSYLGFEGDKEIDRVRNMRSFIEACNQKTPNEKARRIPSVPDNLDLMYIDDNYGFQPDDLAIALNYATVDPVRLNLNSQFSLALVGKNESTRNQFLQSLLTEVRTHIFDRPVEAYIVDGLSRSLKEWQDEPWVASYGTDYSEVDIILDTLQSRLADRYERVKEEGMAAIAKEPLLLTVIHSSEAINHLSEAKESMEAYKQMSKQYAAMNVLFIFGSVPDTTVSFSGPALLKEIKEEKRAFVFSNLSDHKFFDIPPTQSRAFKASLEDGQAYYLDGSDIEKVRIALA